MTTPSTMSIDQTVFQGTLNVLITGSSSGIGLACAQFLAQQFARFYAQMSAPQQTTSQLTLILTGRDQQKLQAAEQMLIKQVHEYLNRQVPATMINKAFGVQTIACDHSDTAQVHQLTEKFSANAAENHAIPFPNAVIANIGINPIHQNGPKKIASTSSELLLSTFQTNVANTHALLAPLFKRFKQQGGKVVIVGSQAYQYGIRGQLAYNVSKAALLGYFNTVCNEFAGRDVYCHLINPGVVENQRTAKLRSKNADKLDTIAISSEADVAQAIGSALLQTEQQHVLLNIG